MESYLMENKFTDYYRIGGIGGMVSGARQFESDIQRSLCVHREKKLIYYKPGKCAGTSLYHGILKPKMGGWITQKENEMEFNNWIANITDKEWESYYSFMFARNPFDRLVSCWNTIGRSMSFKDFVKSGMFTEEGVPKLLHYQTQISLLEVPDQSYRSDLNALLKVENINNDYKTLENEYDDPYNEILYYETIKIGQYPTGLRVDKAFYDKQHTININGTVSIVDGSMICSPVTAIEHHTRENEAKRQIYLLKPEYFRSFVNDFRRNNLYKKSDSFIGQRLKSTG